MEAIFIKKGGNLNVIEAGEMPTPEIQNEHQVKVKILAAGINPIDTKIRNSPERFPVTLPCILGCDAAGVIEQVGKAVTNFKAGDEVYFSQPGFNHRQGTYAEYTVVDASLLAHKPNSLSFEQAAAAPLVLITAWEALYDRARIKPSDRVLIHAGAGGVGHVAIQLARLAGAHVATTVSSPEKAEFVSRLGAEKTIFYKEENIESEIMQWTEQTGVDVAFDTIGGEVLISCFSCTRNYGDVVSILQPSDKTDWSEARKRNLRFSLELMLSPVMLEDAAGKQHQGNILKQCANLFNSSKLQLPMIKTYPFAQAAKAHQYLEQQHPYGKVVLTRD